MTLRTQVDAVLFDMDGTLLDSSVAVDACWTAVAERHGLDAASVLAVCHGVPARTTLRRILPGLDEASLDAEDAALLRAECAHVEGVRALPGAIELLAFLDAERLPWAVVTSAMPELARVRLAAAGLPVRLLITPADTERGKPHPDPFLAGARLVGTPIERCLAVEDSAGGLAAARASGAVVADVGPGGTTLSALLDSLRG